MNWDLLRPWQRTNALHSLRLLAAGQNVLDAGDTGTGKTFSALATIDGMKRGTLAVVPKISISSWQHWADYLGVGVDLQNVEMLRTGRTPYGWWDRNLPEDGRETVMKCRRCQCTLDPENPFPCHARLNGEHDPEEKTVPWRYGKWHWHPAVQYLVLDEVHRYTGRGSLNARMLIAARRQNIPVLAMSATPAVSPLDLDALGYVLGLHDGGDFENWSRRFGCRRDIRHQWVWRVSDARRLEVMGELNKLLFPDRGCRTRTCDIPGFPARRISAEIVDVKSPEKIDALYAEMADAVAALREKAKNDKAPEMALTKILRAREEVELLKVPAMVEMALSYRAQGIAVAMFVNFKSSLDELRKRLRVDCYIDGTITGAARQRCIDDFQANHSWAIIVNNQAGGVSVSLHDLLGVKRVGLVFPSFSARDMRQVFGRLPREGGKSSVLYRVLFAAKTVEMPLHASLSRKCDNIDALIDADLTPENLRFE